MGFLTKLGKLFLLSALAGFIILSLLFGHFSQVLIPCVFFAVIVSIS